VRPHKYKRAELIRYTEDSVLIFGAEANAQRVLEMLLSDLARFVYIVARVRFQMVIAPLDDKASAAPVFAKLLAFLAFA
jgi:hypothetical protein